MQVSSSSRNYSTYSWDSQEEEYAAQNSSPSTGQNNSSGISSRSCTLKETGHLHLLSQVAHTAPLPTRGSIRTGESSGCLRDSEYSIRLDRGQAETGTEHAVFDQRRLYMRGTSRVERYTSSQQDGKKKSVRDLFTANQ